MRRALFRARFLLSLHLLHILDEIIPGHAHPLQHTSINHNGKRLCTAELDTSSNSCLLSFFREDHCGQVLRHLRGGVGILVGEGRSVDQLLWGHNLAIDTASPLLLSRRPTHAVVPEAAVL